MNAFSQEVPKFDLLGNWITDKQSEADSFKGVIKLTFLDTKKVMINIKPGGEFEYSYQLSNNEACYVIRFNKADMTNNHLPIILFKVVKSNLIKVQVLDYDDLILWDHKETIHNTSFLRRELN
jgi:hypothetical protein